MSRILELQRRLLSKVALNEEHIDIQANGDSVGYSSGDERKDGEEAVQPLFCHPRSVIPRRAKAQNPFGANAQHRGSTGLDDFPQTVFQSIESIDY